ncbi:hypothetical protein EDO6_02452 [Paenibacillus xylanexedens]|nr:hypothetical protein EDO6_02452 [Paenibacillus xylanexedens]
MPAREIIALSIAFTGFSFGNYYSTFPLIEPVSYLPIIK